MKKKIIERDIGSDTSLLCTYEPSLAFSLFGLLLTSFHSLSLSFFFFFFSLHFNNLFHFASLSLSLSFSQCIFAFFQIQLMLHIALCLSNLWSRSHAVYPRLSRRKPRSTMLHLRQRRDAAPATTRWRNTVGNRWGES